MSVRSTALARLHPPTSATVVRLALVALPAVYLLAVLTTPTGRADERSATVDRSPVGAVTSVRPDADGSLHITGWARDVDAATRVGVTAYGLVDGRIAARTRAVASRKAGAAGRPAFDLRVPMTAGQHTVCVAVQNVGVGLSSVLHCVETASSSGHGLGIATRYDSSRSATYNARYNTYSEVQLQTRLVTSVAAETAAVTSRHDPRGAANTAAPDTAADPATGTAAVLVAGWGVDPDFLGRRVAGAVTVDGVQSATFVSKATTRAQRRAGAGRLGAFTLAVQVPTGTHRVCVLLGNVGPGSPVTLPCTRVDVAAPVVVAASGSVDPADYPATGAAAVVIAEALRHIGQRYVWATAGPDTFDCSGLVVYSFAKAGIAVPRIAADQAAAATPISAADARPGDLVFHHDRTGHVFHVGIYLAPGSTVAAIDPAEGVALQSIDAAGATYGSFLHS